jgi:RNA polymerase sigma-70 factor (ECF subfamily)
MANRQGALHAATRSRLETLYTEHVTSVFGYARSRLSEADAEDVTADVFRSAAERLGVEPDLHLTLPWLLTATRNRIIDRWRHQLRWDGRLEVLRRDVEIGPSGGRTDAEDRVLETLERLPADHRAVLVLRYIDGCSSREIAEAIGRSSRAVDSLLARARAGLISSYEEEVAS